MNIYVQRLLNVARACRESPYAHRFGMYDFVHPCGTPACAVGNYAAREDLQDFVQIIRDKYGDFEVMCRGDGTYAHLSRYLNHFGVTDREWYELFAYNGCGNARSSIEAAEYIEAFVARKWPVSKAPDWNVIAASPLIPEHVKSEELVS